MDDMQINPERLGPSSTNPSILINVNERVGLGDPNPAFPLHIEDNTSSEYRITGKQLVLFKNKIAVANQRYVDLKNAEELIKSDITTIGLMLGHDNDLEDFILDNSENDEFKIIFKPKQENTITE